MKWNLWLALSFLVVMIVSGCLQLPEQQLVSEWNEYLDTMNRDSLAFAPLLNEWDKNLNNTEALKELNRKFEVRYMTFKSHLMDFRDFLIRHEVELKKIDAGLYTNHKLTIEDKLAYLELIRDIFSQADNL